MGVFYSGISLFLHIVMPPPCVLVACAVDFLLSWPVVFVSVVCRLSLCRLLSESLPPAVTPLPVAPANCQLLSVHLPSVTANDARRRHTAYGL